MSCWLLANCQPQRWMVRPQWRWSQLCSCAGYRCTGGPVVPYSDKSVPAGRLSPFDRRLPNPWRGLAKATQLVCLPTRLRGYWLTVARLPVFNRRHLDRSNRAADAAASGGVGRSGARRAGRARVLPLGGTRAVRLRRAGGCLVIGAHRRRGSLWHRRAACRHRRPAGLRPRCGRHRRARPVPSGARCCRARCRAARDVREAARADGHRLRPDCGRAGSVRPRQSRSPT